MFLRQFFLNHVFGCGSFNLTDLQQAKSIRSMVGHPLRIVVSNGSVLINGNIRLGFTKFCYSINLDSLTHNGSCFCDYASSLGKPRILSNGFAYRINQSIPLPSPINPPPKTAQTPVTSNTVLLNNLGFNKFAQVKQTAN